MINNLKKEIEKDFDRNKNYNIVIEKASKKTYFCWGHIFATATAIAIFGIVLLNLYNDKENLNIANVEIENSNKSWIIKEVDYEPRKKFSYPMSATEKKWSEKTIVEKFIEVDYFHIKYSPGIGNIVVDKDKINQDLGKTIVKSFNSEEMKWYEAEVSLYSIKKVSEKAAIAVKFENDSNYYAYANVNYTAENFIEVINDLDLKENGTFDFISYNEWYGDREYDYNYIEFLDVDETIIWDMFLKYLEDPNIPVEYCKEHEHKAIIGIHLNLENISFNQEKHDNFIGISEDGYVRCNFFEREKYFYLGEEITRSIYKVFNR